MPTQSVQPSQTVPHSTPPAFYQCRHVFNDGHQCGSPALRGEILCFYHHASRRPLPHNPASPSTEFNLPAPDDLHAVQRGLGELLRLVSHGHIALPNAQLILRSLTAASANLSRIDRQAARRAAAAHRAHQPLPLTV